MRTIKLTLAYDGTDFAGWQTQRGRRTVQQTLEATLEKVTGRPTRTLASGRTDAGVHALGQVVGLKTDTRLPLDVLRRALNAELPHDMAVLDVAEAPSGFHPTRHALRKRYRYVIHDGPVRDVFQRRYCWHYAYGRLDAEAMQRAAAALQGTHDFSSFETSGAPRKTSVRTVSDLTVRRGRGGGLQSPGSGPFLGQEALLSVQTIAREHGSDPIACDAVLRRGRGGEQDFVVLEIEANGFLYNMVRAIVGTLVEVGRGAESETWPGEVLAAGNRRLAGRTAPPQGLFLVQVDYPNL
jgi:tRNA pseudouridine38-40 synthase